MNVRRLHFVYVSANFTRCEMARIRLEQFGKAHHEYTTTAERRVQEAERLIQEAERRAQEEAQQREKAWVRFCGLHMRAMKDEFNWTNNEFTFYGDCLRTFGKDAGARVEREIQAGRTPTLPPLQNAPAMFPKAPPPRTFLQHFWTFGIYKPQIGFSRRMVQMARNAPN